MALLIFTLFLTQLAWAGFIEGQAAYDDKNYPAALYELRKVSNDAKAQYLLAIMYQNGDGVKQSDSEALKWYTKSAQQGYYKAQYNLAYSYRFGEGAKKDFNKAFKWFLKAAEQGHDLSQYYVARMYYSGEGVKNNLIKSREWHERAADQGYKDSQYDLGQMYISGKGGEKDLTLAGYWLTKASDQGDKRAKGTLFNLYSQEINGIEANPGKASELCKDLAESGDASFQFNYAVALGRGLGVVQDFKKANEWMLRAAENGSLQAQEFLKSNMTQKTDAPATMSIIEHKKNSEEEREK